jgi:ATP/maltotriose-dependent transcriptional regulator MalT
VCEAGHIGLTDFINGTLRLNVVSAPSGGGKTTFAAEPAGAAAAARPFRFVSLKRQNARDATNVR